MTRSLLAQGAQVTDKDKVFLVSTANYASVVKGTFVTSKDKVYPDEDGGLP